MTTILALIAALSLAGLPFVVGWRRVGNDTGMARALGLAEKPGFDAEKFARQTGTGLTFRQIVLGTLAWVAGGVTGGWAISPLAALLFGIAGGLLYYGGLSDRRQELRLRQAKDILRGLGVVETLLAQGKSLLDALDESAEAISPDGQMVLRDLVVRLRAAPADRVAAAIQAWTTDWDNPGVDMLATALLASLEGRIETGPLVATLRKTLSGVIEVLSRARAAAKGVEWQARFLALFPPAICVLMALVAPEMGDLWADNPFFLFPVLIGSCLSYLLSMRMIRTGLSIEASMGLHTGEIGELHLDRMGKVL